MTEICARAFAKLNFGLDVGQKMDDGYHEITTIMRSVSLYDDIALRFDGADTLRARTNLRYLPEGDKNIAVRAARLFFDALGLETPGGVIEIKKNIPVCAGMGGGSSDAAAVLRALNSAYGAGMDADTLRALGARLGADVPFCIEGGTALCTGRGERVEQLDTAAGCMVVICKPPFPISTPELFSALDGMKLRCRPDMQALRAAVERGDTPGVARYIYNVFEDVLPPRCGEVMTIKSRLLDFGALGASMTGTGSAVFGLFDDRADALTAHYALSTEYTACFLAETTPKTDIPVNKN